MADGCRIYLGRMPNRATERDVERFFRGYGKITDIILKNGFAFIDFDDPRDAQDAAYDLSGKDLLGDRVLVEVARGTPHGRDRLLDDQKRRAARGGGSSRRSRSRSRSRERRRSRDRSRDRESVCNASGVSNGLPIRHRPPSRKKSSSTSYKLIIENLSSRSTKEDIKDLFRKYGDILYVDANGKRKNEGYVELSSKSDMTKIIDKFDGYELNGRKLKLFPEKKRSPSGSKSPEKSDAENGKDRSASRDGSKSKSRSRSGSRSGSEAANASENE